MRSKIIILIVALFVGAGAALAASAYLTSARKALEASQQPLKVMVAQDDVAAGTSAEEALKSKAFLLEDVPRRFVADGAVSSESDLSGKITVDGIQKGEQVVSARLSLPAEAGLVNTVPKGMLAVSVPCDEFKGVAGLLLPGDKVAVLATFVPPLVKKDTTRILLTGAEVLAVGPNTTTTPEPSSGVKQASNSIAPAQAASNPATGRVAARTITLAVTPEDAERLVFAQERGRLWMALVARAEDEPEPIAGVDVMNLWR